MIERLNIIGNHLSCESINLKDISLFQWTQFTQLLSKNIECPLIVASNLQCNSHRKPFNQSMKWFSFRMIGIHYLSSPLTITESYPLTAHLPFDRPFWLPLYIKRKVVGSFAHHPTQTYSDDKFYAPPLNQQLPAGFFHQVLTHWSFK